MSSPMETDSAVLSAGAAKFDTISVGLQQEIAKIEGIAGMLQPTWRGKAGEAAQAAFIRFQDAAGIQKQALSEISANIQDSGVKYDATDDDQTSVLAASMLPNIT